MSKEMDDYMSSLSAEERREVFRKYMADHKKRSANKLEEDEGHIHERVRVNDVGHEND